MTGKAPILLLLLLSIPIVLPKTTSAQSSQSENRAVVLVLDKSGSMREENRFMAGWIYTSLLANGAGVMSQRPQCVKP